MPSSIARGLLRLCSSPAVGESSSLSPSSPTPCFLLLSDLGILVTILCYPIGISMFISLIIEGNEHLFLCLLDPWKWKWSCSVMSDSWRPHNPNSVHGISQARILECVAVPSPRGSSWPRNRTQVSHFVGRFFTVWATVESLLDRWLSSFGMCLIKSLPI